MESRVARGNWIEMNWIQSGDRSRDTANVSGAYALYSVEIIKRREGKVVLLQLSFLFLRFRSVPFIGNWLFSHLIVDRSTNKTLTTTRKKKEEEKEQFRQIIIAAIIIVRRSWLGGNEQQAKEKRGIRRQARCFIIFYWAETDGGGGY